MKISYIEKNVKYGFPSGTEVKNLLANAGDARDTGSIPGSGRFPEGGNGNLFQYSCLENSTDRRACWPTYSPRGCKESDMTEHINSYYLSQELSPNA